MDNEDTTKIFEVSEEGNTEMLDVEEIEEKAEEPDIFSEEYKETKKSLKDKWNNLSKKKKIIIIVAAIIVLIGIVVGVLLLTGKEEKPKVKEEEIVIVENQNYRYENGVLKFLDKDKKEIGEYKCKNKNENKCYLAYFDVDDSVDNTKYVHEDKSAVEFQTPIVDDKYVFVYDNPKETDITITLYNFKDNKSEDYYTVIKKGSDDYSFILKDSNSKFGLLYLKDGVNKKIDFKYDYLGYYDGYKNDKRYIAIKDYKYYVIDDSEKELSKPLSDQIAGFNNKYIKTNSNGKYNAYDYEGNKITTNSYDFITFVDEYIVAISNNLMYIMDSKGTNLNVDGYKLYNNLYNRTYFYDDDNKFIEIKNSFEVTKVGNNINIVIYDEDEEKKYTINALEALVNSNIEYISYIEGKLYFYSDSDKSTLIGNYTCKNKNTISSKDSTLDNCFLAKTGSNYTPIINGRYVFINDTLDKNNQAIALYDLQQGKVLANYLKLDTGIDSEERFYSTEKAIIIAQSSNADHYGKYGMIAIGKNEVTKPLEFTFDSIRRWSSSAMLAKKSNGTYAMFNNNGEPLTSEFGYEIIFYDPVKKIVEVKNNKKKVKLFNTEGISITDKWYEEISLDSTDFILGFANKKMDILNYDGSKYCDKCLNIDLFTDDYSKGYNIDDEKVTTYNGKTVVEEIYFNGEGEAEE